MADDRPVETTEEQVGRLERELEDLRSTLVARMARRPTGDIEPTVRSTPKDETLICNGQTVSRTTYAALWDWAQTNGLVISGLFTAGNGSTTFGLPDFRGRVPIGVGTLGADSYALGGVGGASTVTLTVAQMPSHTHTGSTGIDDESHEHPMGHNGHNEGSVGGIGGGGPYSVAGSTQNSSPSWTGGPNSSHTHPITMQNTGGGTAHENRQPYLAINWLIWT